MNFSMKTMMMAAATLMTLGAGAALAGGSSNGGTDCFGNACTPPNWFGNPDRLAGGLGFSGGGYEGFGGAESDGTGQIINREAFSETMGSFTGGFSFNGTTCNSGECPNRADAYGAGSVTQRSGAFLATSGSRAASAAGGQAMGSGSSGAWSFNDND